MGFVTRLMSRFSRRMRRAARKALKVVQRAIKRTARIVVDGIVIIVRRAKTAAKKHHHKMRTSGTYRRKTATVVNLIRKAVAPFVGTGSAVLGSAAVLYLGVYEAIVGETA